MAYLWAYLMETQDVCFWISDILDEEGQVYLLGIVCFPSECFHYILGSLPEGIYKVATQTNCFPCPNSPTIIRLPLAFMLCYDVFFKKVGIEALLDDNYNFYDNIGRVHS